MLIRPDPSEPDGVLVVTQPTHGWVAGQLAAAWGNGAFAAPEVRAAVCLATEQHDVAWTDWERAPTLDPETGLPYAFFRLPLRTRLVMWQGAAARLVLPQSRYAAVLVSMHAVRLHAGFDTAREPPELAAALAEMLAGEAAFQAETLDRLRADAAFGASAAPDAVARNYALLNTCDRFSLALCGEAGAPRTFDRIPTAAQPGAVSLTLSPAQPAGTGGAAESGESAVLAYSVDPWPFRDATVEVVWEGYRLAGRFTDEPALRAALATARWFSRTAVLRPTA